jgi:hypothetical protein
MGTSMFWSYSRKLKLYGESLKPDINTCYIKGKICLYMGELRSCGGATCWEELRHLQTVGGTRACWHILKNISAEIHG